MIKNLPCPFCGSEVEEDIEEHGDGRFTDVVSCSNQECILHDFWMSPKTWNKRYISGGYAGSFDIWNNDEDSIYDEL